MLRKYLTSLSCLTAASITSYLPGNRMNLTSRHFCSSRPSLSSFSFSQKYYFFLNSFFLLYLIFPPLCLATCTCWTLLSHTILIFFQLHRYCLILWYIKSETTDQSSSVGNCFGLKSPSQRNLQLFYLLWGNSGSTVVSKQRGEKKETKEG